MASRAMVVVIDNITLAEESEALRTSRNSVRLPRGSSVLEKQREKGWSLVETFVLPDDSSSSYLNRQSSQNVGVGRVNMNGTPMGQRPDPLSTAPQGWVPSLALMPAGYMKGKLDLLSLYLTRRLWELSVQYDAIAYDKGSKDIKGGMIDCAGWIEFANKLVYDELDGGSRKLLNAKFKTLFDNGAAYLINDWNDTVGGLKTGSGIKIDDMLPGVLIGIDYDANDNDRFKDIDHIVQVLFEPTSHVAMITQSSASGGGVNVKKLSEWYDGMNTKIGTKRMFAVDPYVKARAEVNTYIAKFG